MVDLIHIFLPLLFVCGIAVFVVKSMKNKHDRGTLGKKESKHSQSLLASLIPIGMIFGCGLGAAFSLLVPLSLPVTISLGAGIGLLVGYFAYVYSIGKANSTP